MQGPVVDLVLMVLIILMFGMQQRRRPQIFYRMWFVGWLCVLVAYVIWELPLRMNVWKDVRDAVRYDLVLLGALAFALSFLLTAERLRQTVLLGLAIWIPASVGVDLNILATHPSTLLKYELLGFVVVGHGLAMLTTRLELPKSWVWRRRLVYGVLSVFALCLLVGVWQNSMTDVADAVLAEVYLVAALYYGSLYGRRTFPGVLGTVGMAGWGVFYLVQPYFLQNHPVAAHTFYEFWNLPKYCVGLSMILRIFEDGAEEQARLNAELKDLAHHDALTGLPNRRLLADRLQQTLARTRRESRLMAVLAMDVDHFKAINDTYGHGCGDACLRAVAERLKTRIRHADTLARTGGEEFTAVIGGLNHPNDARKLGEVIVGLFTRPLQVEGVPHPLWVTVSVGGALFPQDGDGAESLIHQADRALYEAKRAGRNCCVFAACGVPIGPGQPGAAAQLQRESAAEPVN